MLLQTSGSSTYKFEEFLQNQSKHKDQRQRRSSGKKPAADDEREPSPSNLIKSFSQLVQESKPERQGSPYQLDDANQHQRAARKNRRASPISEDEDPSPGNLKASDLLQAFDLFSKDTYINERRKEFLKQQQD